MWKLTIKTQKYTENQSKKTSDTLLIEKEITLQLDTKTIQTTILPKQEVAWAIGYVLARKGPLASCHIEPAEHGLLATYSIASPSLDKETPLESPPLLSAKQIRSLMATFQDHAFLYRDTGIAYSAALFTETGIHYFAEDISMLAALYKVMGLAFQKGAQMHTFGLIISGPITHTIMALAGRFNYFSVISRTGITDKAYLLAKEKEILTLCFCRGKHFTCHVGTLKKAS